MKKPKKPYSLGEEIFNSVSHGVGAITAIMGGSVLVTIATYESDAIGVLSAVVFGIGMILLYTMSTLYHAIPFPRAKYVFRILDHSSIFILIAATYTPFLLVLLRGNTRASIVFCALWGLVAAGIVLKVLALKRFEKLGLVLYICMGWAVVLLLSDIIEALSLGGFWLLLAGGLCYTVGIVFYSIRVKYMHSIWHLFVFAGTILHYLCVAIFVY